MLTLITTTYDNRGCVPGESRGISPPAVSRGSTHSHTHSEQKKTRNGYDNCSAKCLTNKIGFIMERKETNAQFVKLINGNDANQQTFVDAVRFTRGRSIETYEQAKSQINEWFNKDENSWNVDEVRKEYEHILNLNPENYRIWKKYREGKSQLPVQKPNGDYVECILESVRVKIGGQCVNVYPDMDSFGINVFGGDGGELLIDLTMVQKILQIKENLKEYRRLFE